MKTFWSAPAQWHFVITLVACLQWPLSAATTPRPPNIVLILADDLGYECFGAYGGTSYKTPAIDKLAAGGMRFDRAYMLPSCSPTRVQLMTGISGKRNYLYWACIDPESVTFGNTLRKAGYSTCMVGKWQLGPELDLPKKMGFDEHCLWQHTRVGARYANPALEINGVPHTYKNGEYGPDIVGDYALDFIERKKDQPFLLYYSMMLAHSPMQPTPANPKYNPKAFGEKHGGPYLTDMIEYMDKLIGKLVAKLDAHGLRENTLIVFAGDNGTTSGTKSRVGNKLVIGAKNTPTDAGTHVPLIVNWPGRIRAGSSCADLIDSTDYLPTFVELAGTRLPKDLEVDGRSFYPQLMGQRGNPREWIFSWWSTRKDDTRDLNAKEYAFTHNFKLYTTGEFYDMCRDIEEKQPLKMDHLQGEAAAAANVLKGVLAEFKKVTPTKPNYKPAKAVDIREVAAN